MRFALDTLLIQLDYSDPDISEQVNIIFHGWPSRIDDYPVSSPSPPHRNRTPDCNIELIVSESYPELPGGKPLFQEKSHALSADLGFVSIFQQRDQSTLYFHDGAIVIIDLAPKPKELAGNDSTHIHATITRELLKAGRLEDILFSGMAPFLRRNGYYLVHAFAAACSGHGVLLVGPSNSGKTTAGLSLTSRGWDYLANDVVLLKSAGNDVYALPTPGAIGISGQTVNLIPGLAPSRGRMSQADIVGKNYLPALNLVPSWGSPAPVRTVCFPTIVSNQIQKMSEVSKAMTLARLIESSSDRWDQAMLVEHLNLLQQLIGNSEGYELRINDEVANWPELLPVSCN